jgi:urease accessory protein
MDLDGGAVVAMVLNPTGGLLAGDVLDTRVELGPGSHVCVSTPSATRVYRSPGPVAVQTFAATVGPGAILEYLPDRLIASRGARLRQSVDISLAPGAIVFLADTWATGRAAREEHWTFDLLESSLAVRDHRGLLLKERSVLHHAGWSELGGTEGLGYVGTVLAAGAADASWLDLAHSLSGPIQGHGPDARAGVTVLSRGGVLVRLLCGSAPALDALVADLWALCRRTLIGLPPLDLRKR